MITAATAITVDVGDVVGVVALNYRLNEIITLIRDEMEQNDISINLFDTRGRYLLSNEFADSTYFYDPENPISLASWSEDLGYTDAEAVLGTLLPPIILFVVMFIAAQLVVFVFYLRFIVRPVVGIGSEL